MLLLILSGDVHNPVSNVMRLAIAQFMEKNKTRNVNEKYSPAIGIIDTVSCVLAHSSMKMCEKWLELKDPLSRALTKQPDVTKVQTKTRNLYKYSNVGKRNSPPVKLQIGSISSLIFLLSYDFAYIRNISRFFNTAKRRSVTSSQAAFEFAQTKTHFLVERTISSIAATNVRVLPVPFNEKISLYFCTFRPIFSLKKSTCWSKQKIRQWKTVCSYDVFDCFFLLHI